MIEADLKISEVIQPATVDLELRGITDKASLLYYLASLLHKAGKISSAAGFLQAVLERETMAPTYMGNFIAIPHGKSDSVLDPCVAFGRSADGIEYETEYGGGLAKLIFMIAIPTGMAAQEYVRVLARLARLLVHEEFVRDLYQARDYRDVIQAIKDGESILETD